jgi:hypothetical protein
VWEGAGGGDRKHCEGFFEGDKSFEGQGTHILLKKLLELHTFTQKFVLHSKYLSLSLKNSNTRLGPSNWLVVGSMQFFLSFFFGTNFNGH